ncbi:ectonucleotide pyrophosphatase/phosphodiesterase family member 7-like [Ptychodera flava]|uniref:ectonucleotide pyrophosphatase/phosphodiesterase family member 7-like n=1 Tax=Ptychodera flava TaxID=63121 RepID=UPI003969F52D
MSTYRALDEEDDDKDMYHRHGSAELLANSYQARKRRCICKCIAAVLLVVVVTTVFAALIMAARRNNHNPERYKVILVLSDGLRWDLYNVSMPNLQSMAETGVKAKSMIPVYPTMSSPSMYSIATGLNVENHGVVDNLAFDPIYKNQTYTFFGALNLTFWWNQPNVEPLWVTATRQGIGSGSMMYPGGNVPIKGILPEKFVYSSAWHWKAYPFKRRVDIVIDWLMKDELDLVYLYFDEPDESLHKHGIGSAEATEKIHEVNDAIGYLLQKIEETELEDIVNVIVISDHGHFMINKSINIFDYVEESDLDFIVTETGPRLLMKPKEERFAAVYEQLSKVDHVHAFKKDDFPERFHYKNNDRILPLIVYSDLGVSFVLGENNTSKSQHGWDNKEEAMFSVFYAKGPAFKRGYQADTIKNVDVYPLMCKLLGVHPRPNNGSFARVQDMLLNSKPNSSTTVKPDM